MLEYRKPYRVMAARVAPWLVATEVWDTSVNIMNLQALTITPMTENDEKNIFGAREESLSVLVGIEVEMEFNGIDNASYVVMSGYSSSSSGSGAAEVRTTRFEGGQNRPYFGLIAQLEADDGGDAHILIPKMQLTNLAALELTAENKFMAPSVPGKGLRLRLSDDSLYPVWDYVEHATLTDPETDFNTAFTALA